MSTMISKKSYINHKLLIVQNEFQVLSALVHYSNMSFSSFRHPDNLSKLCNWFNIPSTSELLCLLQFSHSVIAGGSMLWCLKPFESVYTGDLDLYMEFDCKKRKFSKDLHQLYDREKLVDTFLSKWGYVCEGDSSKYSKPELCPSCQSSDNLFAVKPCDHWLCKNCAAELGTQSGPKCPECKGECTNIIRVRCSVYPHAKEEYQQLNKIKYFKQYTHSLSGRTIQLIVFNDVFESIKSNFDLSCCKVWLNHESWLTLSKSDWELTSEMKAHLRDDVVYDEKVHMRVRKYASRGFFIRLLKAEHVQEYVMRVGAWVLPDVLWTQVVCKFL